MSQEVIDYISKIKQEWQIPVCTKLREMVIESIPPVAERIQYNKPHFLKNGKYVCLISPSKAVISFTVFNAASLNAPPGFFEPTDNPERQTLKIKEGQAVDYTLLAKLVKQAADTISSSTPSVKSGDST